MVTFRSSSSIWTAITALSMSSLLHKQWSVHAVPDVLAEQSLDLAIVSSPEDLMFLVLDATTVATRVPVTALAADGNRVAFSSLDAWGLRARCGLDAGGEHSGPLGRADAEVATSSQGARRPVRLWAP